VNLGKRLAAVVLGVLCFAACTPEADTARGWELAQREGVTIKDLRPAGISAFAPPAPVGVDPALRQYNVRAELMIFPRQTPMVGVLTDALLPARIDAETQRRWRDNGLRIGLLEARRVDLFKSNLSASLDGEVRPLAYSLLNAVRYTPLELTRPQRGTRRVRTAEVDGHWFEHECARRPFPSLR